jgi:hypothetical protein
MVALTSGSFWVAFGMRSENAKPTIEMAMSTNPIVV